MTQVHCCIGSYYDVPCAQDCPTKRAQADATAWAAYSRAWPEAVSGLHVSTGTGIGPDHDQMPRHDYDWRTGEPAAPQAEREAWWARQLQQPKLDWSDSTEGEKT